MRKRGPRTDPQLVARVVLDATLLGDPAAAKRHNMSTKTVCRYRDIAASNPNVSKLVASLWEAADKDWSKGLSTAIRGQIEFLNRSVSCADTSDPEAIKAVTGALETLADVALTKRMLDARLRADGAEAGDVRPDVPEVDDSTDPSIH